MSTHSKRCSRGLLTFFRCRVPCHRKLRRGILQRSSAWPPAILSISIWMASWICSGRGGHPGM